MKKITFNDMIHQTIDNNSLSLPLKKDYETLFKDSYESLGMYRNRLEYINYSYSILTDELLKEISVTTSDYNIKNIYDIGCGSGLLSYWLDQYLNNTIPITAIDKRDSFVFEKDFCNIINSNAIDYLNKIQTDNNLFILSWPPYDNSFAHDFLIKLKNLKKKSYVLYIGERMGGCTGDDDFHLELENHKLLKDNYNHLTFFGINDNLFLYEIVN